MRTDRTDHVTWGAALLLAAALAVVLGTGSAPSPGIEERRPAVAVVKGGDPETVALERHLGHWPAVPGDRAMVAAFLEAEPDSARAHFTMGELAWKEGDLGAAAGSFRRALELDRGYADRKSPLHRGESLTRFTDDGLRIYLRERELRPEDGRVRDVIKDIYFIKRALAGGCD